MKDRISKTIMFFLSAMIMTGIRCVAMRVQGCPPKLSLSACLQYINSASRQISFEGGLLGRYIRAANPPAISPSYAPCWNLGTFS